MAAGLPADIGNANVSNLLAAFDNRFWIAWIWLAGACGRILPWSGGGRRNLSQRIEERGPAEFRWRPGKPAQRD